MKTETVKIIPVEEFLRELGLVIEKEGTIDAAAKAIGVHASSIPQVMRGAAMPGTKMQEHFGIEVRKVLVPKKDTGND